MNKHRKEIGEQSFSALCSTVNGTNDYDKLLELNDMDLFIGLMDYMNNNGSNRINSGLEDVAKCTKKIAGLPEFTKEEPEMLDGEISEDEYELMLEEDADKQEEPDEQEEYSDGDEIDEDDIDEYDEEQYEEDDEESLDGEELDEDELDSFDNREARSIAR